MSKSREMDKSTSKAIIPPAILLNVLGLTTTSRAQIVTHNVVLIILIIAGLVNAAFCVASLAARYVYATGKVSLMEILSSVEDVLTSLRGPLVAVAFVVKRNSTQKLRKAVEDLVTFRFYDGRRMVDLCSLKKELGRRTLLVTFASIVVFLTWEILSRMRPTYTVKEWFVLSPSFLRVGVTVYRYQISAMWFICVTIPFFLSVAAQGLYFFGGACLHKGTEQFYQRVTQIAADASLFKKDNHEMLEIKIKSLIAFRERLRLLCRQLDDAFCFATAFCFGMDSILMISFAAGARILSSHPEPILIVAVIVYGTIVVAFAQPFIQTSQTDAEGKALFGDLMQQLLPVIETAQGYKVKVALETLIFICKTSKLEIAPAGLFHLNRGLFVKTYTLIFTTTILATELFGDCESLRDPYITPPRSSTTSVNVTA